MRLELKTELMPVFDIFVVEEFLYVFFSQTSPKGNTTRHGSEYQNNGGKALKSSARVDIQLWNQTIRFLTVLKFVMNVDKTNMKKTSIKTSRSIPGNMAFSAR